MLHKNVRFGILITKEGDAMYKLCRTDHSARRQRELERGLLEAMKCQRYEDISISDLCQHLQISRKCFYRYFDGKDGALCALIDHTLLEYGERRGASDREHLSDELERVFCFWKEKRELLDALDASGLTRVLAERATVFSCSDAMLLGRLNPLEEGHAAEHLVSFWVCGFIALILSWYRGGFAEPPERMARMTAKYLVTLR